MVADVSQWYVQKGSRVQGPYSTHEVGRYLLLGRVRNTDRVSRDGELWEPVTQVPELIPEELLDLDTDTGWQRFISARTREDQRSESDVVAPDRRSNMDAMQDQIRDDWAIKQQNEAHGAGASALPWSLLGITLGALGIVLYLNSAGGGV